MIEVLENILKYSDTFEDLIEENLLFAPEFELNLENGRFILVSRNPVLKEDCGAIADKIDRINTSDEDALRKFYRETITNGIFTDKGGAGLGLIEMAKVVDEEIRYRFSDLTDDFYMYELILLINNQDIQEHE
jgi:hypothetical protein